jgi:protein-disulfide isomerase
VRKYNAMIEAKRKAARERSMYVNSALAIVIVLIAIIGIGVQANRAKITGTLSAANASATNGVVYGAKAAATVDVFEDFQCPHCLDFEQTVGPTLHNDVLANLAQVRYHTMSFLDSATGSNHYSSRAANAGLCASDVSVDAFVKLHDILFTAAVQPKEGSTGRKDTDFATYAQQAGLTAEQISTFTTCVQTQEHKALVQAITENASKRGISSTPTVLVNGKQVDATLAAVTKAIAAADATGPKPTPSPIPTTSAPPVTSTPTTSTRSTSTPSTSTSS